MSDYGKILMSTANAVGASLKKKMGSLTGFAPVDWAETINKLGNKLPERTVSGAVCSFSDGADDVPMPLVKASITAVQAGSGDPSPSNVRTISGFTTLNFSNVGTVNICDNVFEQGSINVNTGDNTTGANYNRTKNYIAIKANQEYYCKSGYGVYAFFYDDSKNYLGYHGSNLQNKTFTPALLTNAASNGKSFALASFVRFRYGNGTFNNDFCVNYPSSDTTLHTTYAGETIPVWMGGKNVIYSNDASFPMSENGIACPAVTSGNKNTLIFDGHLSLGKWTLKENAPNASNATHQMALIKNGTIVRYITVDPYTFTVDNEDDIYRVRLYVYPNNAESYVKPQLELGDTATTYEPCRYIYGGELNLTTGVLTVTHEYIEFDGSENWVNVGGNYPFAFQIDTGISNKVDNPISAQGITSNLFPQATTDVPSSNAIRWQVGGSTGRIFVYDYNHSGDLTGFTQMLSTNKLQFMYKLATPTTIQLTPEEVRSFLGQNNLWANTGDSEVTYFAQPSGGITPVFTEEVICDNSSASSTLTFTEDWHDYDFLQFKLTNSSSGIITYITTTPDLLDEIFARSSSKVLFNEFSNDQYALYTKSSDLSWSRSKTRNVNVTEVKGLTATNCTVSTEWIYKRGAITASNVTITAPKYFEAYDEIYMASCDGDNEDTMPCILPVRAGCAGYNFYGNNGRNCVRLTGNTAADTYGKDETKNIFAMMGINYEEV